MLWLSFSLVSEAEVDVFLEFSCFFNDPADVGNLISGSSAFSKTSLNVWKFTVHILLKPGLENFEHYFNSMWNECNCAVVWAFFGIAFIWDWNENWLIIREMQIKTTLRLSPHTGQNQFSSVAQSCPTLCDHMNCSTPGLPVHDQLLEFTQIHVHWVSDAIQPSYRLSFPSPPAPNLSQHHGLFKWVSSSHRVVKVLEFQL